MTYGELLQWSNGLADVLRAQGVRAGDRVGIYLKKSLETAIAIYGIWKAEAAYVPLDPTAPPDRLTTILQDCEVRHLVVNASVRSTLAELVSRSPQLQAVVGFTDPNLASKNTIELLTWDDVEQAKTDRAPTTVLSEDSLAYVMYTSGSTGEPKGIMHSHHSGLSFAKLAATTYDLRPEDRLGNHAPLHFDQSTMEYFAGPLVGATTIIIPEVYTKLPASLSELIEKERMTIWYSVPFALIQLLLRGALDQRDLSALRWVLFGGEPFPPKYLAELMRMVPSATFSNVYGPAEVNQCTYFHLPTVKDDAAQIDEEIPIGKIWEESEGFLADDQDEEVPAGQVGELLVRTPTMMLGYWRRPDLDAAAFYRKTLSDGDKAIYYRTGDLMVQRPDGNYLFRGRKDRQIKVRGYRVELDEVESVLSSHAGVEEAATLGLPSEAGQQQVVAMVILNSAEAVTPDQLQAYAATKLPAYAVPAYVWLANDFPRTATNKIDRQAVSKEAELRMARERGHET